ncbi:MAG: hypothetical protein U0Q11_14295 [Vicinamibacterales bacterium]
MTASDELSYVAIRRAGLVAIVAAFCGVAADLVLQYTPNPDHLMSDASLFLLDVSPTRLFIGHYLGVVAILAQTVGF